MNAHTKTVLIAALALSLLAPVALAANDPNGDRSVAENITSMKVGIINTLATWVPFLVLFALLGIALAAIGIGRVFRHSR